MCCCCLAIAIGSRKSKPLLFDEFEMCVVKNEWLESTVILQQCWHESKGTGLSRSVKPFKK